MATSNMALHEYLDKLGVEGDFLRNGIRLLTQLLMELEANEQIGASRYERSPSRRTHRNGYRHRRWETRVGELDLAIPKLREGSYFPSFLEPRRPSEKALLAVVQSAYVQGVSTRKVDELVQSLGLTGIDKSKVSRICKELDEQVDAFRNRPLVDEYPYLWLDAMYLKVREDHRVVSKALVIAIGVRRSGERDVVGFALGASEEQAFWLEFLRSLVHRGLGGVQLVISDSHEGLKGAIQEVLSGSSWQRCRVHFMRNVLAHVPKGERSLVAAALRTIFAQGDLASGKQQAGEVIRAFKARWPKAARVVEDANSDILAYMAFPKTHWTRIYSTNPLERVNKEVRRRTRVVGVFPDDASVERLVGAVLNEMDDDWQDGRKYFGQESMAALYEPEAVMIDAPTPFTLAPIK
jgi:transposase-like protein